MCNHYIFLYLLEKVIQINQTRFILDLPFTAGFDPDPVPHILDPKLSVHVAEKGADRRERRL